MTSISDTLLDDATLEALARRVAARLQTEQAAPDRLLSAAQVATRLCVQRSWVYDHAEELGVVRLGDGPRPRLRFDPEVIAELTVRRRTPGGSRTRTVPRASGMDLLPIKPPTSTRRRRSLG